MDAEFLIPWLFGSVPYLLVYAGGLWFAALSEDTTTQVLLAAVGFAVLLAQWMCATWATWCALLGWVRRFQGERPRRGS